MSLEPNRFLWNSKLQVSDHFSDQTQPNPLIYINNNYELSGTFGSPRFQKKTDAH